MDDDTFQTLCEKASALLESVDLEQYYGGLNAADEAISSLGRAFTAATPEQRAAFSDALTPHARQALGRFMLRAPMLALRGRDAAILREGLLVQALLERRVRDWRDDLVALAPFYYVARELELAPVELFDEVATYAVPDLGQLLSKFGRRTDVTLGAFGWRRVETPEGPTFEMLSWGAKPSGALVGSPTWDSVNGAMVRELLEWVDSQTRPPRPQ